MVKKWMTYLFVLMSTINLSAQDSTFVLGYAPQFVGEKVTMYTYSDYITLTKVAIGESIVGADSLFKIQNRTKTTIKVLIEISKTEAELYLSPNTNYQIEYYKPKDAPISFANQKVEALFYGLDSTDINYRVLQYNQWLDKYIYYNRYNIKKYGFSPYLDTFKIYAYDTYKDLKAPYFINYVRYHIATMERTKDSSKNKKAKANTYLEYIHPYPVYSNHDQYMKFVKSFYPKDFEAFLPQIKASIYLALDDKSPTKLMKALKKDPILQIEELRELMMVNMLGNSYYKRGYDRSSIVTILDSVSRFSNYKPNARTAHNMLTYLTKLENGYPAPELNMTNSSGDVVNWGTFKGKFVYVNFFASWNQTSVTEIKLIKALKTKYNNEIAFVSFNMDKTVEDYNRFMEQNNDIDWDVFYLGESHDLIDQFNVKSIPQYFLIDQEGFIALAPAKRPSPNGEYESIDKTFHYIQTELRRQLPSNRGGR